MKKKQPQQHSSECSHDKNENMPIAGSNCLPGHPFVLHVAEEEDDPEQSVPPFSGPSFDLRRVLLPEPHDLEQELHDPHWFHLHDTEINSNISVG